MKLFLVGHSYRYAIEQAIVAFLNRKAVLCDSTGRFDRGKDILIDRRRTKFTRPRLELGGEI